MKFLSRYRKSLQNLLQNSEYLSLNAGDQHEKKLLQTLIALRHNELDKYFEYLAQGQIV